MALEDHNTLDATLPFGSRNSDKQPGSPLAAKRPSQESQSNSTNDMLLDRAQPFGSRNSDKQPGSPLAAKRPE